MDSTSNNISCEGISAAMVVLICPNLLLLLSIAVYLISAQEWQVYTCPPVDRHFPY